MLGILGWCQHAETTAHPSKLFDVCCTQCREPGRAELGEGEAHHAAVVLIDAAADETIGDRSIDEFDHTVVLQEKVLGDVADRRVAAMTPNRQEELVLSRGESRLACGRLAPAEELAKAVAELEQCGEVVVAQTSGCRAHLRTVPSGKLGSQA